MLDNVEERVWLLEKDLVTTSEAFRLSDEEIMRRFHEANMSF